MKKLRLLLILALTPAVASGTLRASGAGTTSGLTLLEPISAKAAGMAESGCSLSGEVYNFNYNPASIVTLSGQEASVMYKRGFDEDTVGSVMYGKNFSFASLAGSVLYYNTGDVTMYNASGQEVTETGQKDVVVIIGGAREIKGYPVGVNLKYISSEIFGEKASAFAVDLGAQYKGLAENLDVGLAVRNIGTEMEYIDEGDPLPLNICPGGSYTCKIKDDYVLLGALDLPYYTNEEEILMLLGLNCVYREMLALRLGYRLNISETKNEDEPLDAGFGFTWKKYTLDYAIGITRNLDNPHNISFSMKF
ncbi:MAG: PorV/PorQ family protein [Elusimicrobia bacterium]|nr:PorV/PorQ family protein [Elusimicrobiota bacterium]